MDCPAARGETRIQCFGLFVLPLARVRVANGGPHHCLEEERCEYRIHAAGHGYGAVVQCTCGGAFLVKECHLGCDPLCPQVPGGPCVLDTHVQFPLQGAQQPSQQLKGHPVWSCDLPLGAS